MDTANGGGMTPRTGLAVDLGQYVRPLDVAPDDDAFHRDEGYVWSIDVACDPDTGEVLVRYQTVRIDHRAHKARWGRVDSDNAAEPDPINRAYVRRLVRCLADHVANGKGPLTEGDMHTLDVALRLAVAVAA